MTIRTSPDRSGNPPNGGRDRSSVDVAKALTGGLAVLGAAGIFGAALGASVNAGSEGEVSTATQMLSAPTTPERSLSRDNGEATLPPIEEVVPRRHAVTESAEVDDPRQGRDHSDLGDDEPSAGASSGEAASRGSASTGSASSGPASSGSTSASNSAPTPAPTPAPVTPPRAQTRGTG